MYTDYEIRGITVLATSLKGSGLLTRLHKNIYSLVGERHIFGTYTYVLDFFLVCNLCLQNTLIQLFSLLLQIIHLKRFQFVNGRWIKSQKIVKFPRESFDPSAFLVPRDPALCQRKPLTPQGDDLSEPRIPTGEVKKADAQNSAGEDVVLLSKSPSSLSANVVSSPKGEEPKAHSRGGPSWAL